MPVTYNGIGTHYYGKKNVQTRLGTCRSCGKNSQLSSYDTRLWFVIVFIPIIPLGRKRILDACPNCRRHYAAELEKWETARQLEVSGAKEKFRSNPTPEGAIAVHQQLLGFHQLAEAAEFEQVMRSQFSDNAKIHAYLGSAHEHLGQLKLAKELYARALVLRPDMPEARAGAARGCIRAGQFDEARKHLDFLEKPGAAQLYSLEPLELLARAYQDGGYHEQALQLFGKILEGIPKAAEHPRFRKFVVKSEKALGRTTSLLPKQPFSLKRLFSRSPGVSVVPARVLLALGVILALALLAFAISNEYFRHHRKIYLVNAYDQPASVEIPGVGIARNLKGIRPLSLPEGHYHAIIRGPVEHELDFEVRDTYFNRWFGNPVWLINVGGGALFEEMVATYSRNPQPPVISFHTGLPFEKFDTVTHAFTPLPEHVQVDSGGSRTLVGLDLFKGPATAVFVYAERSRGIGEAMTFAERWLRGHPEDETMLRTYEASAQRAKQLERAGVFLRSGLTNRPVRIAWHRTHMNLHDSATERVTLLDEYEQLARAEPTNSALLYLRGRLEQNPALARDYFKRAAAADPQNQFAAWGLGYDRMAVGDWAGARPHFAHAVELSVHDPIFANGLFITRLALGEAPALEEESRNQLKRQPLDAMAEVHLIQTLAVQGRRDEALKSFSSFAGTCRSQYGSDGDQVARPVEYEARYALGDFDQLKSLAMADRSSQGRAALAEALVELGQPQEAAKTLPADLNWEERGIFWIALAVASRDRGDAQAAAEWKSQAIRHLEQKGGSSFETARLLRQINPPTRDQLDALVLPPEVKAVLLAMLSQEYPPARTELAGFARQLNVSRTFPYHLVHRVTAETR